MDKRRKVQIQIDKSPNKLDHATRAWLEAEKTKIENELENHKKDLAEISSLFLPWKAAEINLARLNGANNKLERFIKDAEQENGQIEQTISDIKEVLQMVEGKTVKDIDSFLAGSFMREKMKKNSMLKNLIDTIKTKDAKTFIKQNERQIKVWREQKQDIIEQLPGTKKAVETEIEGTLRRLQVEVEEKLWKVYLGTPSIKIDSKKMFEMKKVYIEEIYKKIVEYRKKYSNRIKEAHDKLKGTYEYKFLDQGVQKKLVMAGQRAIISAMKAFEMSEEDQKVQYEHFKADVAQYSEYFPDRQVLTLSGFKQANDIYNSILAKNDAYKNAERKKLEMNTKAIELLGKSIKTMNMIDKKLRNMCDLIKETEMSGSEQEKVSQNVVDSSEIDTLEPDSNEVDTNEHYDTASQPSSDSFDLQVLDEEINEAFRSGQINFNDGVREIKNLSNSIGRLNGAYEAGRRCVVTLGHDRQRTQELIEKMEKYVSQDTDGWQKFYNGLQSMIVPGIEYVNLGRDQLSALTSVIDYCDSMDNIFQVTLKNWISENQEILPNTKIDIVRSQSDVSKNKKKMDSLREEIKKCQQDAEQRIKQIEQNGNYNITINISDNKGKYIYSKLKQRYQDFTKEIDQKTKDLGWTTKQLSSLQEASAVSQGHDTAPIILRPIEEALGEAMLENRRLYKNKQDIRDYTEDLRNVYHEKFGRQNGTEIDINHAIASAKYLCDQPLDFEYREKAIANAAKIIHEFKVDLDSFRFNIKTLKMEIVNNPSDTKTNRGLVPIKLNSYGDLWIGNKRPKASVIATLEGQPDVVVLSIRAKEAYGQELFNPDTPTPQSGRANFDDWGELKQDGDMDVLANTAIREFREEAKDHELVQDTLKFTANDNVRVKEYIRYFTAVARPTDTKISVEEAPDTIGSWQLNVMDMINKSNVHHDYDRTNMTEDILRKAAEQNAIERYRGRNDSRRKTYVVDSYDVKYLMDYIEDRIHQILKEQMPKLEQYFQNIEKKNDFLGM